MEYNKSTWREQRLTVPAGQVQTVYFDDTKPNHAYVANNGAIQMYFSLSSVSESTFDMILPPFGTRLYAREMGFQQFQVYNPGTDDIQIMVTSFEGKFDPATLPQTQEIVSNSASGLLGTMNVKTIIDPLPEGTNHIGVVSLDNHVDYTSLLAGIINKLIESVQEQKSQADESGGEVSFSQPINTLQIDNLDTSNNGTFVVNGISVIVPAGKSFKASFGGNPSTVVSVTGSTNYLLTRFQ